MGDDSDTKENSSDLLYLFTILILILDFLVIYL